MSAMKRRTEPCRQNDQLGAKNGDVVVAVLAVDAVLLARAPRRTPPTNASRSAGALAEELDEDHVAARAVPSTPTSARGAVVDACAVPVASSAASTARCISTWVVSSWVGAQAAAEPAGELHAERIGRREADQIAEPVAVEPARRGHVDRVEAVLLDLPQRDAASATGRRRSSTGTNSKNTPRSGIISMPGSPLWSVVAKMPPSVAL